MTPRTYPRGRWIIYEGVPADIRRTFYARSKEYGQGHAAYLAYLLECQDEAERWEATAARDERAMED